MMYHLGLGDAVLWLRDRVRPWSKTASGENGLNELLEAEDPRSPSKGHHDGENEAAPQVAKVSLRVGQTTFFNSTWDCSKNSLNSYPAREPGRIRHFAHGA